MQLSKNNSAFRGFDGRRLTVAITDVIPYMRVETTTKGHHVRGGIDWNFLQILSEVMHFRIKVVLPSDGPFGGRAKDGHWTGMVGMVSRKEADLGMSYLDVTEERLNAVDFSYPYKLSPMKIMSRKDGIVTQKSNIFLRAYDSQMWLNVGICVVCVMLFLVIVCKIFHKGERHKPCWFVYSSLLFQASARDVPANCSTQIFLMFWWWFVIVVMNTFCGMVISNATMTMENKGINSLPELVRSIQRGRHYFTQMESSSVLEALRISNSEEMQTLYKMVQSNPQWLSASFDEVLQKLRTGRYAYIDMDHMEVEAFHQNMTLYFSQETIKVTFQGIAIPKNALFKASLDRCSNKCSWTLQVLVNANLLRLVWKPILSFGRIQNGEGSFFHIDGRPQLRLLHFFHCLCSGSLLAYL